MSFRSSGGAPLRGDPRLLSIIPIGISGYLLKTLSGYQAACCNPYRIEEEELPREMDTQKIVSTPNC